MLYSDLDAAWPLPPPQTTFPRHQSHEPIITIPQIAKFTLFLIEFFRQIKLLRTPRKMQNPSLSAMDFEIKHQQPTDDNISKLLQHRPGSYNITKTYPISDEQIVETVASALQRTPTNDDTTCIVILLKKEYDSFTEIVRTVAAKKKGLKKEPARTQVLSKGYGTVWLNLPLEEVTMLTCANRCSSTQTQARFHSRYWQVPTARPDFKSPRIRMSRTLCADKSISSGLHWRRRGWVPPTLQSGC
jgi:hypothetical protein